MAARLTPAEKAELAPALADICDGPSRIVPFLRGGGVVRYLGPAAGYRVRAFGFSSTATDGPESAVANWCRAVRMRAAK